MKDDFHRRSWRQRNLARGRTPVWFVADQHGGWSIGSVKKLSGGTYMALDPMGDVVGYRRTKEAAEELLRP
jgi:hypothetical protein